MDKILTNQPLVSVIMPVFNGEKFIDEAISSILNQSYSNLELIIVNDGSRDKSLEIIESYKDKRIRLVNNRNNLGLIKSLNKGIRLAEGKYIARMDADDISISSRLQMEYDYLEKNSAVVLVGTGADILDMKGKYLKTQKMPYSDGSIRKMMLVTNTFFHGSVMARKDVLIKAGLYRTCAPVAEDYDLWSRVMDLGKMANLNKSLYQYRVNPQGESLKKRLIQKQSTKTINDYLWTKESLSRNEWKLIWPEDCSKMDNSEKRFYQYLHVQFAKKFRERWNLVESLAHIVGAVQWMPLTVSPYFYLLLWVMPMNLFCRFEEFLLYNLFLKKNYQER